jgi:hypothetical protein
VNLFGCVHATAKDAGKASEKTDEEEVYTFDLQLKPLDRKAAAASLALPATPAAATTPAAGSSAEASQTPGGPRMSVLMPPGAQASLAAAAAAAERERERVKQLNQANTTVAFIKTVAAIDPATPFSAQLHLCQLNPNAPFDSILSYVRHCFLPYSRALMASVLDDGDDKKDPANAGLCALGTSSHFIALV